MVAQKHATPGPASKWKKRQITYGTFEKWQKQYNTDYQMLAWLWCETEKIDKSTVTALWCEMYRRYESKITSQRNFSRVWIEGSTNHRTSNVVDHVTSCQHSAAMNLAKIDQAKDSGKPLMTVVPIVRLLMKLDAQSWERLRRKFDCLSLWLKREFHLPSTLHCTS